MVVYLVSTSNAHTANELLAITLYSIALGHNFLWWRMQHERIDKVNERRSSYGAAANDGNVLSHTVLLSKQVATSISMATDF